MIGRFGKLILVLAIIVVAASSCSTRQDLAAAEREVEKFHQAYNAGRFDDIYEETAEELKKSANQEDFVAMLQTVQRKLGKMTETKRDNWTVNFGTGGTTVKLVYETSFAQGKGTETFNYQISGKTALLMRYDITSKNLLPR
jgi:opacity protein-like surface antigen